MKKSGKSYAVKRSITCGDCIHEYACQMWMGGTNHNTDARNCTNYETVKDSASYFIGVLDGKKSNTNQYVIDRLHDLINSLEEVRESEVSE